jgi:hypothetical protein
VLRQRGVGRLPEEAAYLADRYGDSDHPEAATFTARVQAAADGRPVNEFEGVIERGLDRLPHVGLWVDPSGLDPEGASLDLAVSLIGRPCRFQVLMSLSK